MSDAGAGVGVDDTVDGGGAGGSVIDLDELTLPGFIAESDVLPPSRGLGLRLLVLLVGLGLLIGISVAGGAVLLTAIWPDRGDMCDASAGPCSELSVAQTSNFSGIDLPATAEIVNARYETVDDAGLLSATIVLTKGEQDPLRSSDLRVTPSLDWANDVDQLGLTQVVLYERSGAPGDTVSEAASGQDADGRTVILIRSSRTL